MWSIVKPCISSLPLALSSDELTSVFYQLNCHFWGECFQWLGYSFSGTYDLETWRPVSKIPADNIQLQLFYKNTRCNW